MGRNDDAWEKLFDQYHILDEIDRQGKFVISANQIKQFREPRLMTKFDHKVNLPAIFADYRLAILPITRGDYVISNFSAYWDFEETACEAERVSIPSHLNSLTPQFLVSEAIALNCAYACGVFHRFLNDDKIVSTVSGRMGSGSFDFDINTAARRQRIAVNNSQIEIDAAYEGCKYLSLIEAKKELSDDFLIRQLYYPFRTWSGRVRKPVKPIFFIFSNGMFRLYEYRFEDPSHYNSLYLVQQKNYLIETKISLSDIEILLRSAVLEPEPELPFPQANSMHRIINLIERLNEKPLKSQDITEGYAFNKRQTNYYADAGQYLGLIEKERNDKDTVLFRLSDLGRQIMQLEYRERQIAIITQILKHKVFWETMKLYLQFGKMPDKNKLVQIMREASLYNVRSDSTIERRSSTVTSWINWILSIVDDGASTA